MRAARRTTPGADDRPGPRMGSPILGTGAPAGRGVRRLELALPTVLAGLAAALAGCGGGGSDDDVARLSGGGVEVAVRLAPWDGSRGTVVATLTPARGFHLYGADLPAGGVDGVGQRTRVVAGGALAPTGPARVDARVRSLRVTGVARPLPVYPEGPVRVSVPVRRARDGRATISLSYGACSRVSCQVPVVGRNVALDVP